MMSLVVKIVKISVLAYFFAFMSACSHEKPQAEEALSVFPPIDSKVSMQRIDTSKYVVLPFSKKSDFIFKGAKPSELSESEIKTVYVLLEKCVAEHNQAQEKDFHDMTRAYPEIPFKKENYFISLPAYKQQLIVVTDSEDEKQVWVNCFCGGSESYWRKEVVDVIDGGNCFFNVKINLTQAIWYDMMVNGSA